ncbi:hypothetical protein [Mycolicibacterium mageritense]
MLTAIHDGKDERLAYAMRELSITATRTEIHLTADQWHTLIAAARVILLALEKAGKPIPESTLTAALGQRGFTADHVRDAVKLLRGEKVVTRTDGVITDRTGTEHRAARRLSAVSLSPRNTAKPASAPASSTAAVRPRMPVGALIERPDKLDMGARLRAQAEQMPTASFEVGDTANPASKVKKPSAPTIPDSVLVSYIDAITSAFARHGKPSATWRELGVRLPPTALPEGVTRQTTAAAALDKLAASRTIRHENGVYTHVPAEHAVAGLTKWIGESAKAGALITPAAARALAQREDVQKLTPNGWNAETLVALALDAVTESGVIERVDGGWMKPAPKTEQKPEAPAPAPKPKTAPEPAGDTTSTKPKTEGKKTKPETPPAAPPVSNTALERKVDVLTGEVRAIGKRLHTLPAPPSAEKVLLDEADSAVKALLESVCVRLKVDGNGTEGAIHRALPGKSKPSRVNPNPVDRRLRLGEALTLGVDARILAFDHITRKYRLITVANLMPKTELERRVKRIKDMRDAAA